MSGGVYGGDEIGALVFDFGSCTIRAGFAGEDTPKADLPSAIGVLNESNPATENTTEDGHIGDNRKDDSFVGKKLYIGTTKMKIPKPNMELVNLVKDGMIDDWDLFENITDHLYANYLHSDSKFHPVLMSEASWNSKTNREKLTELMFEKYEIPAFFICKNAVLTAFAHGRGTGVVLDSGAEQTTAVPVHDGFVLKNAIVKSPLAGDFVTSQCRQYFDSNNIEVIPSYLVASKEVVGEGIPAVAKRKSGINVSQSYHDYMVKEVIQDFSASVLQVSTDVPYEEDTISQMPTVNYEFPDGYTHAFGEERFRIPEGLFNTSMIQTTEGGIVSNTSMMGMSGIVATSVGMCDIDARPALYNNVITTGGNSLLLGFADRLNRDLSSKVTSNIKLKVIANSGTAERRFSSWIGGSILASLGSFHQMWISHQDYDESGKGIVEKKCP